MKKTIITFISLLVLLLTVVSVTYAFFTDAVSTGVDDLTSAGLSVRVIEKMNNAGMEVNFPKDGLTGVMPAQVASKIVRLENNGDAPAWIRVRAVATAADAEGNPLPGEIKGEPILLFTPHDSWVLKEDGYFYYTKILAPGKTVVFVDTVTVNPAMTNEYAGGKADLKITVQAVQSNFNGETVDRAIGWPTED